MWRPTLRGSLEPPLTQSSVAYEQSWLEQSWLLTMHAWLEQSCHRVTACHRRSHTHPPEISNVTGQRNRSSTRPTSEGSVIALSRNCTSTSTGHPCTENRNTHKKEIASGGSPPTPYAVSVWEQPDATRTPHNTRNTPACITPLPFRLDRGGSAAWAVAFKLGRGAALPRPPQKSSFSTQTGTRPGPHFSS